MRLKSLWKPWRYGSRVTQDLDIPVSSSPLISLVICTLDEADSIEAVLNSAHQALTGRRYEIIVVDDSADEATADVIRQHALCNRQVRLLRRRGVRGLASACIAGWDSARGDILGVMDGDGQHDATLIASLANAICDGSDIAVASRFAGPSVGTRDIGLAGFRKALSVLGVRLSKLLLGTHTSDPMAGFFFQSRDWYKLVRPHLSGVGFKILIDIMTSGTRRPRLLEVSTRLLPRLGGSSKLDLRIIVELAAQLVERRTGGIVPSRFVLFMAVGLSGVVVHLATLGLGKQTLGLDLWQAQLIAITTAMVSNFTLNNLITFRDLRLSGMAWWRGMLGFALACSSGALISEILATVLSQFRLHWMLAGLIGALASALWNYWSSSRAAWGVPARGRDPALGQQITVLEPSIFKPR